MIDILCAVALDLILGDPIWFPHPVRFMGHLIAIEEKLVRKYLTTSRGLRLGGFLIVLCNMIVAFCVPYLLLRALTAYPLLARLMNILLLYTCFAARCLRDEAVKVSHALRQGIEQARHRLSFIVGRDTTHLTEPEIIRATVETVAENTSDGIIAPLLCAMIGGAPLAMLYKMVNTMDSMLGYTHENYRDIGFFPAKIDDVVNYIPARLTGVLMLLGSLFRFQVRQGFKIMIRDRKNHKSPNCAYPEGAVAGLLGVQLGGANMYFGEIVHKSTIGDPLRELEQQDISRTIEIMFRAEGLSLLGYMAVKFIV